MYWHTQKGFNPHWMFLTVFAQKCCPSSAPVSIIMLNFVQENVKNCTRTLISHFASFCFNCPQTPGSIHFQKNSWSITPSIIKPGFVYVMAVFQNVWFQPWFHLGPRWVANSALPELIAGFTGPTSYWIQTCLLLKKITPFSHSDRPTGIVTTTA